MTITPEILEKMLSAGKSLAYWAQELGRKEYSLAVELQVLAAENKGTQIGNMALRAMQVTSRAEAGVAAATGAGVTTEAAVGWGVRILIGGALIVGVCLALYLAYQIYSNWDSKNKKEPGISSTATGLGNPTVPGKTSGNGPLSGTVESGGSSAPPTNPGRIDEVRKTAKRELISIPDGVGTDEIIKGASYTGTSLGPVNPELAARIKQWEKRIDEGVDDLYHHGAFDGFGDTWLNVLKWKPYPTVVKAELKQNGNTVTGFVWINVGDHPDGFRTKKLPVTRGVASGSRGFEDLQIELADGQVRGTLYLLERGESIEGELNGAYVSLSGHRLDDARKGLEANLPRPTR